MKCLHDVLWPLPTVISYEFNAAARSQARIRRAWSRCDTGPRSCDGERQPGRDPSHVRPVAHQAAQPARSSGSSCGFLGELFAALPTIQAVTVSALQIQPRRQTAALHRFGAGRARGVVSAAFERFRHRGPGDSLPAWSLRSAHSSTRLALSCGSRTLRLTGSTPGVARCTQDRLMTVSACCSGPATVAPPIAAALPPQAQARQPCLAPTRRWRCHQRQAFVDNLGFASGA